MASALMYLSFLQALKNNTESATNENKTDFFMQGFYKNLAKINKLVAIKTIKTFCNTTRLLIAEHQL
jgi:hypothetical protein